MSPHRRGTVFVVGLGPGSLGLLTPDALAAIEAADVVVGYRGYLERIGDRLSGKQVVGREVGEELQRAEDALRLAEDGNTVALVSGGDAGIYGMGGVVWELAATRSPALPEIVVVPGVTAASAAAALLGAPLAHDWACVSLSDLLTPWDVIERRVEAAARADFVLVLYNPASQTRTWQLPAVADLLLNHRAPSTPVGLVENAYRDGERVEVIRLDELAGSYVSMFTIVIIGNSRTFAQGRHMITPRIHEAKAEANRARSVGSEEASPNPPTPAPAIGDEILAESLAIIDRELGAEPSDPSERAVVRRMIHASADFDFARNVRFRPGAIAAAVAAFRDGAPIVTDVEMLRAGVRAELADPLGVSTLCGLNDPETAALAAADGLTRSAAGLRRAIDQVGHGAVVAIGNAPSALDEALWLVEENGWRPACLIGMPVGFIGVEEAKRRLRDEDRVPSITSLGCKGGTAVTAAALNALLELARDEAVRSS